MMVQNDVVNHRADFIGWRFPQFENDADELARAWIDDEEDELGAYGRAASARVLFDDLAHILFMIPRRIEEGNVADAAWMARNARVALARLALGLRL